MIFDEFFDALASLFEELLVGVLAAVVATLNVGWRWFLRGLYVFVALGGLYVLATYEQPSGAGLLGAGLFCLAVDLGVLVRGLI
ncbi:MULTISPECIES: hypothetical protein [Haloprofundus]|uniref:hypothetical protein n=1 Tax=Haloprofundus TaxID=1911573 RepID=UPI000E44B453|nr:MULTISPECIES: hypothetical protein [Haloprofundus]QCJ46328.1 hypothetical protein FCF25_03975 [Haloprofundus sp. MHR1]